MTTPNQTNVPDSANPADDGASTPMLDAATHGQVLENTTEDQQMADMMDDSQRTDRDQLQANGPVAASSDNLPRELTNPSDTAYTLPEEQ